MGAWSAWQVGVQHTYAPTDAALHRHTGRYAEAVTEDTNLYGAPLVDAKASLDQSQIDTSAGSLLNYQKATDCGAVIVARKSAPTAPNSYGNYFDDFQLSQNIATFDGTGHESERFYDPSVFTGMTPGVDYDESMIQYEAATSTIAGWADWTIDILFGGWTARKTYGTHVDPLPGATVPTFRFQAFDAELVVDPNDIAALTWQPYGAGVEVGSFAPAGIDVTSTASQSFSGSATLALPAVGAAPILSVVVYSDFQGPLAQPITNFAVAADRATSDDTEGNTYEAEHQLSVGATFYGIGIGRRSIDGVLTQLVPEVVYQSPRWRYWRPNASAGRLHTVGGHFRSAGGAQINMMQQDGLGPWLPIEDS